MSETMGFIDDVGELRSDVNQVNEEAVKKVQASGKKAKQIAQDIKKDQEINNKMAKFLGFLLNTIEQEEVVNALYETFFKTVDTSKKVTYLRKEVNVYVIVGFFVPFFPEEMKKCKIESFFAPLGVDQATESVENYFSYLKALDESYHDNIPINQSAFIELFFLIIKYFLSPKMKKNLSDDAIRSLLKEQFALQ